jgi:hypothetical protein
MRTHKNDKQVVEKLANQDYSDWISGIRGILQQPESPLSLKNGTWTVHKRKEMWELLGAHLFDEHLNRFKEIAVDVLKEPDPKFELPPEERFAANVHGKVLRHSQGLRKGLSESLALLGTRPEAIKNCSSGKAEFVVVTSIREIFEDADWVLWGSLNSLLPTLAEAAPGEFLRAVENALKKDPCPFDGLFSQEGSGITGGNYMSGLLWALETLAWDEQYLVRVTVLLGKLASRDPGGNWGNRPANSLTTIFLPWLPQTIASVKKRKAAIQTLLRESPEIGWKLLLDLLPNQHQSSGGCQKPMWRKIIPDNWEKGVTNKEYWDQISSYANLAVEAAKGDFVKLNELISNLDNLTEPSCEKLLEYLGTEEIVGSSEERRTPLWTALVRFAIKHKNYSDAKWALSPELVERIEQVAKNLAPENPLNRHSRLFNQYDTELYEARGDYEEQREKLEERRQEAIREIFEYGGFEAVFDFAQDVSHTRSAGFSFGVVADESQDVLILPDLLQREDDKTDEFVSMFVLGRYKSQGWKWVDKIDTRNWAKPQIGRFLSYLPSTTKTWEYSKELLGEAEGEYWTRASVNPFDSESNLDYAVDKLLEYDRPNEAISCLYGILHNKKPLDASKAVAALLGAVNSDKRRHPMDIYNTVEIIKALQTAPDINKDDLFRVEWAYLTLLTGPGREASPKLLEQKLASEADFFCEAIRVLYRSKKEPKSDKESTEQEKAVASNVWRLLHDWKTLPGTQDDGSFSASDFNKWIENVKKQCEESGHLEVALSTIGGVLIHYIADPDGLWIHRAIAEALNAEDAGRIRHGFSIGTANSRGVHFVDPTGNPEKELAAKYRQQADEVENETYFRFADTLRSLAASYEEEAKRIIEEHKDRQETEQGD